MKYRLLGCHLVTYFKAETLHVYEVSYLFYELHSTFYNEMLYFVGLNVSNCKIQSMAEQDDIQQTTHATACVLR
jgi:hypothetical protein